MKNILIYYNDINNSFDMNYILEYIIYALNSKGNLFLIVVLMQCIFIEYIECIRIFIIIFRIDRMFKMNVKYFSVFIFVRLCKQVYFLCTLVFFLYFKMKCFH